MREKDEKAKVARELPVESRGLQRRSKRGVNTAVPTATPRWCKYWSVETAYGKRGVQLGSSPNETVGKFSAFQCVCDMI